MSSAKVPRPRTLGRTVAERRLRLPADGKAAITVRIGAPRRVRGWDWGCPVEIAGAARRELRYLFGADAFQALQLALDYIAVRIDTHAENPYWLSPADGAGFARSVPGSLPRDVREQILASAEAAAIRWRERRSHPATGRQW